MRACTRTSYSAPRPRKKAKTAQHRDRASPLLYVHRDTLACALGRCVPCLYKLWPGGRPGLPPNVRPELCPRARDAAAAARGGAPPLRVRPLARRALLWPNVHVGGGALAAELRTLHRGRAVVGPTAKLGVNVWICDGVTTGLEEVREV